MAVVHYYVAYGLRIQSEFLLLELVEAPPGDVDIVVAKAIIRRPPVPARQLRVVEFGADEQYLGFLAIGRYLIRGIDRIDVEPDRGFDENLIGFSLLGPVMAVMLHLRSMFTLHGSAADVRGGAVVFLGDKGAGKSTTIGAMAAAGYPVLSDDIVAITGIAAGLPILLPAFPMIKLTDAAIAELRDVEFDLIETNIPNFDKRRVRLRGPFSTTPVAPRAAYVLARGDKARVEALTPIEAYQALLRYSYATRFGDRLIHGRAAADHMRHCAELTRHIPISRLTVPDGLTEIRDAVELVEKAAG